MGIFDETIGKLRNMHETVLVHADVHERAKIGHIGHNPRARHSRFHIAEFSKIFAEGKDHKWIAWIASWFLKLACEIAKRELAHLGFERVVVGDPFCAGARELCNGFAEALCQSIEARVLLWVNASIVERILS